MKSVRLRTEYLSNPQGIDIAVPRLSWNCTDGKIQSAYRIKAWDEEGSSVWDTGKVLSGQMVHILWNGRKLKSRDHISWKVRLWEEAEEPGEWSQEAFFEMGFLADHDWKASWITGNYMVNRYRRYPVDCFRKKFHIYKEVKKARLYATACGLYELCLNNTRVGDFVLAPGITDYNKRVQYQTYDVTALLLSQENEMTLMLADGWYRGSVGAWGLTNQYGIETKFLGQLEIIYEDGSKDVLCSDESWEWSNDGPIRFADNKDGEIVDAAKVPSYCRKAKVTKHAVVPSASNHAALMENEKFSAELTVTPSGKKLLDFGQNFAGYLSFDIQAEEGQKLVLRFGELLDEYGELTQENIQCNKGKKKTPLQQVVYRAKAGENKYKTRFAIFGFQYVEIDTDIALLAENFTGIAVYSGFTQTGRFRSSNQLLNRFVQAAIWSAKSNSADLPTDCPTRERHGWTGDAQIFFESASYLFDYASFAKKYLRDVYDWQKKSGKLPQIAPMGGVDFYMNVMNGSAGWSDIGILLPYHFWKLFGDEQILEDYYDGMRAYAGFLMRRCGKWGGPYAKPLHLSGREKRFVVNTGQSYGEWAEPADVSVLHWYDFARPHPEVSTAYTAYMMDLMEQIAVQLGKTEDIAGYHRYKEGCREAYRELVKTKAYSLDTDRQARLVRPLAFGLLDKEQEKFAKKRLLQALENYGWRLGTGFLSTPLILDVLMEIDPEAAYRLLENEEIPGWLSMPKAGATTIWESWEGPHAAAGVGSLNHYSKGAICRWLFASMCGIKPAGENAFLISPQPGGHVMFAEASYYSVYGMVSSGWERKEDGKLEYRISIPANTTAAIILPDGREYHYGAGNYQL